MHDLQDSVCRFLDVRELDAQRPLDEDCLDLLTAHDSADTASSCLSVVVTVDAGDVVQILTGRSDGKATVLCSVFIDEFLLSRVGGHSPQLGRIVECDFIIFNHYVNRLVTLTFEYRHVISCELQTDSDVSADGAIIHGSGCR